MKNLFQRLRKSRRQNRQCIDKRNCGLEVIPEKIMRCKESIEELRLDENRIRELPSHFFDLCSLRELGLRDNQLEILPQNIKNLQNLVELDVSKNQLIDLPDEIAELKCLKMLNISENPIENLADKAVSLCNLTILNMNYMLLEDLPAGIGELKNLVSIELRENLIFSLPLSFARLAKLERLDLGKNQLQEFPCSVCMLSNLDELWLDENEITDLPGEIENLTSLTFLNLSKNLIKSVPNTIGDLSKLKALFLADNLISSLPDEIGGLSDLRIVNISRNRIFELNPSIGNCLNLEELVLTENFLVELPHSVGNLSRLKYLNIDRNRLTILPKELGELLELKVLSVRGNELTFIPNEIESCVKLRVLDVSDNTLQTLPFTITNLKIRGLWLSENQAKPMPSFQTDYDFDSGDPILRCFLLPQIKDKDSYCHTDKYYKSASNISGDTCGKSRSLYSEDADPQECPQGIVGANLVKFHSVEGLDNTNGDKSFALARKKTPHPKELRDMAKKLFDTKLDKTLDIAEDKLNTSKETDTKILLDHKGDTPFLSHEYEMPHVNVNETSNPEKQYHRDLDNIHNHYTSTKSFSEDLPIQNINLQTTEMSENKKEYFEGSICENKLYSIDEYLSNPRVAHEKIQLTSSSNNLIGTYDESQDVLEAKAAVSPEERDIKMGSLNVSRDLTVFVEQKGDEKLGLSISTIMNTATHGDSYGGVFVSKIAPESPAHYGGLQENDILLSVNGTSVSNLAHQEVVNHLKDAGKFITLGIRRKENLHTNTKCMENISQENLNLESDNLLNEPISFNSLGTVNYISPSCYMANRPSRLRQNQLGQYNCLKFGENFS